MRREPELFEEAGGLFVERPVVETEARNPAASRLFLYGCEQRPPHSLPSRIWGYRDVVDVQRPSCLREGVVGPVHVLGPHAAAKVRSKLARNLSPYLWHRDVARARANLDEALERLTSREDTRALGYAYVTLANVEWLAARHRDGE